MFWFTLYRGGEVNAARMRARAGCYDGAEMGRMGWRWSGWVITPGYYLLYAAAHGRMCVSRTAYRAGDAIGGGRGIYSAVRRVGVVVQ